MAIYEDTVHGYYTGYSLLAIYSVYLIVFLLPTNALCYLMYYAWLDNGVKAINKLVNVN